MAFQAYVRFPGVQQVLSCDFTFGLGVSPSQAQISIAPQEGLILNEGTLLIGMNGREVAFPGCTVRAPTIRRDEGGLILSFTLEDRRWRWRFGEVYGRYNIKRADGTVNTILSQEKTPQEMASILLDAMGESGYNVSALPTQTWRPERQWDGPNPADELDDLCDYLGCRVCLGLDNRVKIVRLGTGNSLPEFQSRRRRNYGLTVSGVPGSLKVVCGPTLYQSKLFLEAVGLDSDGRTKKINDLSYKPANGWSKESPEGFFSISNKSDRRLAARTVWRWYRIKSQSDKQTIEPLGFPKQVLFYHYLLPIRGVLIQEQLDQQRDPNETNNIHPLPAFVEGVFLKKDFSFGGSDLYSDIQQGATTDGAGNTLFGSRYVGGFSLDEERGVVEFSDWVVKYDKANKSFSEAELYLNCSYSVRDPESKMPYRYGVTQSLGGNAGVRVISAPDIQAKIRIVYDNTGKGTTGSIDNIEEKVKPAANELLAAAAAEYQTPQTEDAEYAGIEYIDLDGAIQQVGWTVSGSGVLTRASRNTEYDLAVPDFKKRREQRKIAALAKEQFLPRLIVGAR